MRNQMASVLFAVATAATALSAQAHEEEPLIFFPAK
jgi:hypothetical protein